MRFYIIYFMVMDSLEKRNKITISKSRASKLLKEEDAALLSNLAENGSDKLDINVARQLIKSKKIGILARNLSRFEWLDVDIAERLIKHGFMESLAKNLSSFEKLNQKIAKAIMEKRMGSVACNLKSFENLDNSVAKTLIENNYYDAVARDIASFKSLTNETLLSLLVKCNKYKGRILLYRSIFPNWWARNNTLLRSLKVKGKDVEYKKLKEFYDKVDFEQKKGEFDLKKNTNGWFGISKAQEAVKYWKWEEVVQNLDSFQENHKELINFLIKKWCIDDVKKFLSNLWWKDLDWKYIVNQIALTNDYNTLIKYADNFKAEWVSNENLGHSIIKNCDLSYRDSVKSLADYSDNEEWDWINYNFDLYDLIEKRRVDEFLELIEYFRIEISPLSDNEKLPLKLKNLVKERFWIEVVEQYQDLFE